MGNNRKPDGKTAYASCRGERTAESPDGISVVDLVSYEEVVTIALSGFDPFQSVIVGDTLYVAYAEDRQLSSQDLISVVDLRAAPPVQTWVTQMPVDYVHQLLIRDNILYVIGEGWDYSMRLAYIPRYDLRTKVWLEPATTGAYWIHGGGGGAMSSAWPPPAARWVGWRWTPCPILAPRRPPGTTSPLSWSCPSSSGGRAATGWARAPTAVWTSLSSTPGKTVPPPRSTLLEAFVPLSKMLGYKKDPNGRIALVDRRPCGGA